MEAVRSGPKVAFTMMLKALGGKGPSKVPNIAVPASLRTVVTKSGLVTRPKAAVRSRGLEMSVLSRTGRIGCPCPADGSKEEAVDKRSIWAERIESRDRACWELESEAEQPICELKYAWNFCWVVVDRKP
jgi:hypothetical protein